MRASTHLISLVTVIAVVLVLVTTVVPSISANQPFAPQPTPVPSPTIPYTDVNPYGANFFEEWEAEEWKIQKTFEMANAAGIRWARQDFPWDSLQLSPGQNGYWNDHINDSAWAKYDRIVKLAQQYHLEVIARLDRPPSWTRQDNSLPEAPPDNYQLYGDFVYDVVKHFKGQIHYYQIWNEPNIYPEWGNQPPNAAAYVQLLRIAYQRAKEADPSVVILSAPLAQTLENSDRNESDLRYLQQMYDAGAKPYFDILMANAYGFAYPPDDPPSPNRLNFQRVTLLRQIMVQNGDAGKPIWFNEFGWDAAPPSFPANNLPWARVTEQQQATYTVEAIRYARAHWPWAGVFNIWFFRQDIPPDRPDYYFRMVDPGFTPRPLYNAVKTATAQDLTPAPPGTYSVTDPSADFSGSWEPAPQASAIGGVVESSSTPGDSLTLTFRGGGLSLGFQRRPNAGQVYLTVDGREANRLSDHVQGRSVLNLNGPDQSPPKMIPVADGLGPGQHVARLVIGTADGPEHGPVEVTGFAVTSVDRFAALGRALLGVVAVLLVGGVAQVVVRVWPGGR